MNAESRTAFREARCEVTAFLADGSIKATWTGTPLLRSRGAHVVAARWTRGPVTAGPLTFAPQDLLVQYYHEKRWYNIFALWDRQGCPKGWYVNLARPALVEARSGCWRVRYQDLALDFVVTRNQAVELDVEAWNEAKGQLPASDRRRAEQAASRLRSRLLGVGPQQAWSQLARQLRDAAALPVERHLPELVGQYGEPVATAVTLRWRWERLRGWQRLQRQGQRDGEALFVLRLPDGRTLVHTKRGYPPGTMRLPGGGIARGESPAEAAVREAREETGLETRVLGLLAYARCRLAYRGGALEVPNFVFLLEPLDEDPNPRLAADEGITEWRRVDWRDLPQIADALEHLPTSWSAWGAYRALPHRLAYEALRRRWSW